MLWQLRQWLQPQLRDYAELLPDWLMQAAVRCECQPSLGSQPTKLHAELRDSCAASVLIGQGALQKGPCHNGVGMVGRPTCY